MAIIKTNRNGWTMSAIWEDIRPSGDRIYFWGEGYNKTNIQYEWDSQIQFNTTGTSVTGWGQPSFSVSPTTIRSDFLIYVAGETVHVNHYNTTNNAVGNNLDVTAKWSLDPQNQANHYKYIVTNTGDNALYSSFCDYQNAGATLFYNIRFNHQGSLDTSRPTKNTSLGVTNVWPVWFNPATNNLIAVNCANTTYPFLQSGPGRIQNILTDAGVTAATFSAVAQVTTGWHQFLGVSSSGQSLWLRNLTLNDHSQTFFSYDDSANTVTTLATFTAVPEAGGTNAGGARGTTFGNAVVRFGSLTFEDPTVVETKAFYLPYLDINGQYHPILMKWNASFNTFQRFTDITMNWGDTSQDSVWAPDITSASSSVATFASQRFWYNETFTAIDDEQEEKRFLSLIQTHGNGIVNDVDPRRRTIVTFEIDQTDLRNLNYHSHIVVPRTIKNTIWLNDERTVIGVFTWDNFYIYSFNAEPGVGWQLVANLPYRYEAVGRDSFGRIWAVDGGTLNHGRLHLITPSIPAVINVSLDQNNYNYTGSPIDSTGTVEALGLNGQRVSIAVKLRVLGNSLKIINNEEEEVSEIIIQTSSSEPTLFNIRIVNAGNSSIFASVEI
jgi:hypothetical protein